MLVFINDLPDCVQWEPRLFAGDCILYRCIRSQDDCNILQDILNINNVYFDNMVSQIYPLELQLNKANTSDTKAAFLDLHLSISNGIVSTKKYDKRGDFDFEIVNFPF